MKIAAARTSQRPILHFDYYEHDLEPSPGLKFLSKRFSLTPK
ncbi:MAG: hypothetical protein ACI9KE_004017 [Polyangiales bacterium]|jgi:hypothetical protein